VPQCAQPMEGYEKAGCIFEIFWDEPVLIQPSGQGGTNWSPMPYDPDTGYFYVPGTDSNEFVLARSQPIYHRSTLTNGTQAPPIGSPLGGTFTAIDSTTNKIVWQHKLPYRMGGDGGSTVTARGSPVSWRTRRQLCSGRRQDRRGALEVPNRFWC
jgi:quinohemoprotein ethanol dehydrogenase